MSASILRTVTLRVENTSCERPRSAPEWLGSVWHPKINPSIRGTLVGQGGCRPGQGREAGQERGTAAAQGGPGGSSGAGHSAWLVEWKCIACIFWTINTCCTILLSHGCAVEGRDRCATCGAEGSGQRSPPTSCLAAGA